MSEFKVQVQTLYGIMDSAEQLEKTLQQVAEGVKSVKRNLRAQIRQRERIDSRLNTTGQQLDAQRMSVGRVVSVGRQVAGLYQDTEQGLLDAKTKTPFAPKELFSRKNLLKLVGEAGLVGQAAMTAASFADGEWWAGSKGVAKYVGKAAKLVDKTEPVTWKDYLGWVNRSPKPESFGDAWGQQLGKYKIGRGQTAGKNVAAAAKWAGDIITVAETGASNLDEFKDNGGWENPRMYAETVVESGLKIGSGLAIGAAVAALTPVGWTALAVGAATVATTAVANWALDGVSQLITGNSDGWVENLSDGIIDGITDLGKAIGNGVKKTGESVAKWWNNLWS